MFNTLTLMKLDFKGQTNLGNFYEPTREIWDEPSVSYQTNFVRVYTSEERRAGGGMRRTYHTLDRRFEQ